MNSINTTPATLTQTVEVAELLFDMDGTLVYSIPAVEDAWRTWADEEGVTLPDVLAFHGRTALDLVTSFVTPERIAPAVQRLNELESTSSVPVPMTDGARELLAALPPERWGVVTSAARPVALTRLAAGGVPQPDHLVTGSDVRNGKPHPEPFQLGRRQPDAVAIAFEDTVAGLRSAKGAGCLTVGIVGTETADELRDDADFVVASLAAVTVVEVNDTGVTLRIESI